MDTLAFDGRMGASGDMILGALLDLGADRTSLAPVEEALGLRYRVEDVVKGGIAATSVTILDEDGTPLGTVGEAGRDGEEDAGSETEDGRTVAAVIEVIESLPLEDEVGAAAASIVERLGAAEAAVHGASPEEVHFHEVGADDAIADVVGACLLLDDLDVDRVVTTPIAVGGGTVRMGHGEYPVPGPAVTALAEGAPWSISGGPVDVELLTPTGAAILAEYADGVTWLPAMDLEAVGYGAGDRDVATLPNVLRAIRGRDDRGLRREDIVVLETNLDDVSPEILGGLQERLAPAGALDVAVAPLTMKKSRPGHLVRAVARPEDVERVADALARETGTLGVRATGTTHRWIADREVVDVTVELDGGSYRIGVKVAADAAGHVYDLSAEFDDAAAIAAETGRPVRAVMAMAEALAAERRVEGDHVGSESRG